jgi:DNA polymerase I-like protein with 3'-5' exonuclease and polymerase domains
MVAACRWKGYAINKEGIEKLREEAKQTFEGVHLAPSKVKEHLLQFCSDVDKTIIQGSTKRVILEDFAYNDVWAGTDISREAKKVLDARRAKNEYDMLTKLIQANRFHASFVVIGTLSSRMAGADQLNPQGIKRETYVREMFPLADDGYVLCGGDFVSFEVVLADAVYHDDKLRTDLQSGRSIHAVFGTCVYPDMTYEEIIKDKEKYTRSKSAVFAMIYGGMAYTLKTRLGVPEDHAEEAYQRFMSLYPGVAKRREEITNKFCAMRQEGGVGTNIEWCEPEDKISSLFGFSRYFTLENKVCEALFNLANSMPKEWRNFKEKVNRRDDRVQTVVGATQTALYHAAFNLQSSNMRAAGNHVIQSSGAQITKEVQRKIWDLQPYGVSRWHVQPMNIHDEIMCPTLPELADKVEEVVNETIDSFKDKVPLLAIEWSKNLKSWADK